MNKIKLSIPVLAFIFAFALPSLTHADTFNFNLISHNGDGQGYSTTHNPAYKEGNYFYGNYQNIGNDSLAACNGAAQRFGLSSTYDMYCVYDGQETYIPGAGGCFYTTGGVCTSSGQSTATSPPGSWPQSASDSSNGYFEQIQLSLYPIVSLEQHPLASMENALNFNLNNNLCDLGYCPSGRMTDPGYRDVCSLSHADNPSGNPVFTGPATACDIYHHTAVGAPPIASLTANPSSISPGSSSLLTYSCNGGATSASIDQGIGARTPASAGSVSVTPTSNTTYTLTCTNANGSSTDSASVSLATQIAVSCTVTPSSISSGSSATWTATATGHPGLWRQTAYGATSNGLRCKSDPQLATACDIAANYTNSTTGAPGYVPGQCYSTPVGGQQTLYYCNEEANLTRKYSWSGTDGLTGTTGSVTKQYDTAGPKTATVTTSYDTQSPNKDLSATATCSLDVTVSSQPDLTAGSITPTTATASAAATLSATVNNIGTTPTGAAFIDLFQRATDSSGTGATDIGTYSNAALAASGSNTASLSYTFPSAGTFYVRACADKSSAGNGGVIAEADETNNCGAWTAVTVAPPPSPTPTCSISANPSTLPSTLTWSSTNATSCTGSGFSTGGATSGTAPATVAGTYLLSCTGSGGTCPAQSVTVGAQSCTNPTATITAAPNRIQPNTSTVLSWSASGVNTSCTISGPGVSQPAPAASCSVAPGTIPTPPLTTQSTYKITCDGTVLSTVIINVVPKFQEF